MRFIRQMVLPCIAFLIISGCRNRTEPEPIWIGHLAPLSGSQKRFSAHARQAIVLAVEEANREENRILGRRIAVLHVDSLGDLDALQPEVVRLITVNRVVALLGGTSTVEVERLGHAAQPYDVPLVTAAALPLELFADNVFSINASLAFEGRVLARFATKEWKAERVAVLADGRQREKMALAEAFDLEYSSGGGHALRQWIYRSEAELAKAIEGCRELKLQVILYAGAAVDLEKVRALLQHAGLTMPLLFGAAGDHLEELELDLKSLNGIYLATPYALEAGISELKKFANEYQERFHELPGTNALLSYDGVRIIFQALRRANSTSAVRVRDELAKPASADFESLTGPLTFDKNHAARRPLFMVRMENGKVRDPKRFDPETK
jgi:branched-chain amino acid transport system substrate-binding protein